MIKVYKKKRYKKQNLNVNFETIIFVNIQKGNIIISITNMKGDIINWFSSGCLKLKGFRKGSPLAAKLMSNCLVDRLQNYNIKKFVLKIRGQGLIKKMFLKYLALTKLNILKLYDISNIAFNGCKKQKQRKL